MCGNSREEHPVECVHSNYYDYFAAEYKYNFVNKKKFSAAALLWFEKYIDVLPFNNASGVKSIGEGLTPLIKSKKYKNCVFKDEARNPSGCFKDRECAAFMPYFIERGVRKFALASSGNAALSASLYARLYGAEVVCFIPRHTSTVKKKLIALYGGETVEAGNTYEECHRALLDSQEYKEYVNITAGILSLKDQGNKVIAFEIWEAMDGVPDYVLMPLANGCLLAGIYRGFLELHTLGLIEKMPILVGVQIAGADPIVHALKKGVKDFVILDHNNDSLAEGLVATESFCSPKALQALRDTKGFIIPIPEESLKDGMRYAIEIEGLIPEWTACSSFAAVKYLYAQYNISENAKVVVLNTGSGLKEIEHIAVTLQKAL